MANPDSSSRLGFRRAFPLDPDPFVRSRTRSLRTKLAALLWPVAVKAHQWFTPRLDLAALDSVLVLGNQKTGSTAIARLLAAYGELGVASDIHLLQSADLQVTNDPAWVGAFIQQARYYFRQSVIKENALTPATGALLDVLPKARPIYITRHPVHNIRSILDRLNLPGTPRPLDALELEDDGWTSIVDSRHLGFEAADHIASLAQRWTYMTAIYRRHRDRLTLVPMRTLWRTSWRRSNTSPANSASLHARTSGRCWTFRFSRAAPIVQRRLRRSFRLMRWLSSTGTAPQEWTHSTTNRSLRPRPHDCLAATDGATGGSGQRALSLDAEAPRQRTACAHLSQRR